MGGKHSSNKKKTEDVRTSSTAHPSPFNVTSSMGSQHFRPPTSRPAPTPTSRQNPTHSKVEKDETALDYLNWMATESSKAKPVQNTASSLMASDAWTVKSPTRASTEQSLYKLSRQEFKARVAELEAEELRREAEIAHQKKMDEERHRAVIQERIRVDELAAQQQQRREAAALKQKEEEQRRAAALRAQHEHEERAAAAAYKQQQEVARAAALEEQRKQHIREERIRAFIADQRERERIQAAKEQEEARAAEVAARQLLLEKRIAERVAREKKEEDERWVAEERHRQARIRAVLEEKREQTERNAAAYQQQQERIRAAALEDQQQLIREERSRAERVALAAKQEQERLQAAKAAQQEQEQEGLRATLAARQERQRIEAAKLAAQQEREKIRAALAAVSVKPGTIFERSAVPAVAAISRPIAPVTSQSVVQPTSHGRFDNDSDDDLLAHLSINDAGTPVYALSVTDQRVVVFEPAREKFIEGSRARVRLRTIEEHAIYHVSSISRDEIGELTAPSDLTRKQYLQRGKFVFGSVASYRELILPALLLGNRVRDFEQRCASVEQIGTVVLVMPAQNGRLKKLKLKTTAGNTFEIDVKFVKKGKEEDLDKKWTVFCHPPKTPLPVEVKRGAMLEILCTHAGQPRVTDALMRTHSNRRSPIDNWSLLSAIYGARSKKNFPSPSPINSRIQLAKLAGSVQLNPEQAEAVALYNCDAIPAFVVESPPGSGKTMTAAAMAVSYRGTGVQLFLSTANVPVINIALALAKLDYTGLKPLHFISSEREELMTDETRSPFTALSIAKEDEFLNEKITKLEEQMKHASNEEERAKLRADIRKVCGPIFNGDYNVFFSTVDMILGRLTTWAQQVDFIKKTLMNDVRRIVVDEASQLTESALNSLILCFPQAQIVLIGDSKQLPPFKYVAGDVVSELAARSALEVIKDKMNLPVIKLNRVYRASPRLAAHYSNVFYGGTLVSEKPESEKKPLSCFGSQSAGNPCLFWKVKGHQKQSGTSKINEMEMRQLKYLVNILRNSNYDEKSVMIISYYEAQRKRAEEVLEEKYGEGYEVLTVDSAQGREKKIVLVLTTRTSVPTDKGAFFSCPLRCNVAVSRHQEALIVLGHPSIASAPNWATVLSTKYFRHVQYRP